MKSIWSWSMHKEFDIPEVSPKAGKVSAPGSNVNAVAKFAMGAVPWLIIAGLLYAGLFVKPKPVGSAVYPPAIDRNDLLLGATAIGDKTAWLVGNFGKILRTDDGGEHWRLQKSGTDEHLQDVDAWNDKQALAVGNNGILLETGDGGDHWAKITTPRSEIANKIIRVHTLPGGEAWAVGEVGKILHSSDYGLTWARMRPEEDVIINDLAVVAPDNIWAVGEYGRMFHSKDLGKTWIDVKTQSPGSITAVAFRDAENGVAVGVDGAILWTSDGGKEWHFIPGDKTGNIQHLLAVQWDAAESCWIATGNKGVWVKADPTVSKFTVGKFSSSDLSPHTKIVFMGKQVIVAGAHAGLWDGTTWTTLVGK
jgi:photosystem II stability/assembly factor-like uncharacterized protein